MVGPRLYTYLQRFTFRHLHSRFINKSHFLGNFCCHKTVLSLSYSWKHVGSNFFLGSNYYNYFHSFFPYWYSAWNFPGKYHSWKPKKYLKTFVLLSSLSQSVRTHHFSLVENPLIRYGWYATWSWSCKKKKTSQKLQFWAISNHICQAPFFVLIRK